ncbi:hypothetical protein [Haloferula sp. A504]|uniref:hypothetical protein n=1 Tax=Haloferula sp. A504 TaxID=3373601 RepID=UPI0031BE5BE6|nr:hypothetical protein [Verrucomicrobiaceae bacterium E54]
MNRFEIHPRPTGDGVNLSGETLGGAAGCHWFRSVRSAAEYALHRAGMLAEDSKLIVHRPDGTTEERVMHGNGAPGLAMNTASASCF